jgi:hypothetical protein
MAITALDCPTRGSLGVCPECGRSVPDTCGKDDPRAEAPTPTATDEQKASEPSQEATGESEATQATQVAEAPKELTTEAPTKTTSRKAASK